MRTQQETTVHPEMGTQRRKFLVKLGNDVLAYRDDSKETSCQYRNRLSCIFRFVYYMQCQPTKAHASWCQTHRKSYLHEQI